MKSANYVKAQRDKWIKAGIDLMLVAWKVALLCVGWPYVFGALGELCTPGQRGKYAKSKGADHPTIASKCQVLRENDPKADCEGCKWFPGEERVRMFDCRGFTRWVLQIVYGFTLQGAGATSQWDTKSNWKAQGTIDTMPKDTLVCLFAYVKKTGKMKHTALGWNNETCECSVGVQHKTKRDGQFTHWALPACCAADYVPPKQEEKPKEDKPVTKYRQIKKGNTGEAVKTLQKMLEKLGYNLGVCGVDGDFGIATEKAVKQFQKDHGLKQDGIVGDKTWAALDKATSEPVPEKRYVVTITDLTLDQAKALCESNKNATYKEMV